MSLSAFVRMCPLSPADGRSTIDALTIDHRVTRLPTEGDATDAVGLPTLLKGGAVTVISYGRKASGKTHTIRQLQAGVVKALLEAPSSSVTASVVRVDGSSMYDVVGETDMGVRKAGFAHPDKRRVVPVTSTDSLPSLFIGQDDDDSRHPDDPRHRHHHHHPSTVVTELTYRTGQSSGVLTCVDLAADAACTILDTVKRSDRSAASQDTLVLGRCLQAKIQGAFVPWRESALTMLLKPRLTAGSLVFVAAVHQDEMNYEHAQATLSFVNGLVHAYAKVPRMVTARRRTTTPAFELCTPSPGSSVSPTFHRHRATPAASPPVTEACDDWGLTQTSVSLLPGSLSPPLQGPAQAGPGVATAGTSPAHVPHPHADAEHPPTQGHLEPHGNPREPSKPPGTPVVAPRLSITTTAGVESEVAMSLVRTATHVEQLAHTVASQMQVLLTSPTKKSTSGVSVMTQTPTNKRRVSQQAAGGAGVEVGVGGGPGRSPPSRTASSRMSVVRASMASTGGAADLPAPPMFRPSPRRRSVNNPTPSAASPLPIPPSVPAKPRRHAPSRAPSAAAGRAGYRASSAVPSTAAIASRTPSRSGSPRVPVTRPASTRTPPRRRSPATATVTSTATRTLSRSPVVVSRSLSSASNHMVPSKGSLAQFAQPMPATHSSPLNVAKPKSKSSALVTSPRHPLLVATSPMCSSRRIVRKGAGCTSLDDLVPTKSPTLSRRALTPTSKRKLGQAKLEARRVARTNALRAIKQAEALKSAKAVAKQAAEVGKDRLRRASMSSTSSTSSAGAPIIPSSTPIPATLTSTSTSASRSASPSTMMTSSPVVMTSLNQMAAKSRAASIIQLWVRAGQATSRLNRIRRSCGLPPVSSWLCRTTSPSVLISEVVHSDGVFGSAASADDDENPGVGPDPKPLTSCHSAVSVISVESFDAAKHIPAARGRDGSGSGVGGGAQTRVPTAGRPPRRPSTGPFGVSIDDTLAASAEDVNPESPNASEDLAGALFLPVNSRAATTLLQRCGSSQSVKSVTLLRKPSLRESSSSGQQSQRLLRCSTATT